MVGTLADFKKKAKECRDEFEADRVALTWLRLTAMEHGETGEHAIALLSVIENMLKL